MQMEGLGAPDMMLTRGNDPAVAVDRSDLIQPGDVLELVLPLPGQEAFSVSRAAGALIP
jgi:polysaccharide biosynthesis/export protein ExoF